MLDTVYKKSEDVVSREIAGELIIVPVTSGIGDLDDEIYTLNETGRVIWDLLDGKRTLRHIAGDIEEKYDAPSGDIERDVQGLVAELSKRRIVIAV